MIIHLHPFHPLIITDVLTHYAFCVRNALCFDGIRLPFDLLHQCLRFYDIQNISVCMKTFLLVFKEKSFRKHFVSTFQIQIVHEIRIELLCFVELFDLFQILK